MSTARYSGAIYGSTGLTYGARAINRQLTWILLIDWDNDGVFNGDNEAARIFDLETTNGRQFYMKSDGSGPEEVSEGSVSLSLDNHDGRFDPYNLSSPLAGYIMPGRKFQLKVVDEATGTIYPIMTGAIEEIRPNYGAIDTVKMTLINEKRQLSKTIVRTTVQQNMRYDDALDKILDTIGWSASKRDIDSNISEVMPYWWGGGNDAWTEMQGVADAALGMLCISEDGKLTYISRISGDSSTVTLGDSDVTLDYGIRTPSPWETVRNRIWIYARAWHQSTDVELWNSNDQLMILPGESKALWATYTAGGESAVATSVTQPVANTDYMFNSAPDGTGTDLTSYISIVMSAFATTAKLTITNSGATTAYRKLLKLRGNAITPDKYTYVERTDQASIDDYGDLLYEIKSDWLQDVNTAIDEANILIARLVTARQYPRVKISDKPSKQFALKLFRLVNTNFVCKGISGEFRVGYIKHRWLDRTGDRVETEIFLEPNLMSNLSGTWIFPATMGVTTVF